MEKTIIYIGGFELPDKNAAAHRVLNNGKVLEKLGYKVIFIDVNKELISKNIKSDIYGFDRYSISYPKSSKEWLKYISSIDYLKEISNKYKNITHIICYNYPAVSFFKLKIYCKKNNIKLISDCTEWYDTKGKNISFKIIKGMDTFFRMRILQKRIDGIIVISNFLEKYYKNCKNIINIPPLVDLNEDKWKEIKINKKNNIKLIYAGSPGISKDKLNHIIESLHFFKDKNYLFEIIGLSKEQYLKDYPRQKTILEELKNKIIFCGRISHLECIKKIKEANFSFILREVNRVTMAGFSTKFVEAISCGTPVIANDTSDLKDYIINGKNGFLLEENSVKEIKNILENIFNMNYDELESMKRYCSLSKKFHYENYIKNLKQIF